jgi:hypothetical protein
MCVVIFQLEINTGVRLNLCSCFFLVYSKSWKLLQKAAKCVSMPVLYRVITIHYAMELLTQGKFGNDIVGDRLMCSLWTVCTVVQLHKIDNYRLCCQTDNSCS